MRITKVWPSDASARREAITRVARTAGPLVNPSTVVAPHATTTASTTTWRTGSRACSAASRIHGRDCEGASASSGVDRTGLAATSVIGRSPFGSGPAGRRG